MCYGKEDFTTRNNFVKTNEYGDENSIHAHLGEAGEQAPMIPRPDRLRTALHRPAPPCTGTPPMTLRQARTALHRPALA